MRFGREIARAVREVVPRSIALGARITGSDWRDDGLTPDDAVTYSQGADDRRPRLYRRVVRRHHRRHPQSDRAGLQRADRRAGQEGGRHRHPRRRPDHHAGAGRGHRRRGQGRHGRAGRARCSTIRAGAGTPAWSSAPTWRACRSICAPAPKLWAPAAQRAARREIGHRDGANLAIDAERLWGEIMETAAIGGTAKGGICRLTLTDLDRQVRDWFKARAEALGCRVTVDDMGAMFARRDGQRGHAADRLRQPSRHPADRRQVRRRAGRARRARSAAHAGRGRLRDLRADRGGELDQRGGLALCAGDGRVRRVFAGRWKRTGRRRRRIATA